MCPLVSPPFLPPTKVDVRRVWLAFRMKCTNRQRGVRHTESGRVMYCVQKEPVGTHLNCRTHQNLVLIQSFSLSLIVWCVCANIHTESQTKLQRRHFMHFEWHNTLHFIPHFHNNECRNNHRPATISLDTVCPAHHPHHRQPHHHPYLFTTVYLRSFNRSRIIILFLQLHHSFQHQVRLLRYMYAMSVSVY